MKELTIEEKAKAYDEAIERAKKLYGNGITEEIFPELKEDDTKRIRKNCINFLELQKQHHAATFEIEECIDWFEKQGKKSADKIEPRFKVGDWVVNKFGDSWHIDSLDKKNYQVSNGKGNYNYFPISKQDEMHLWAIQDAKDGDVLVCDINKAEIGGDVEKLPNIVSTIFNFKKLINTRGYIHSYCHLYDKRFLGLQSTMYYNSFVYNISPATKEQRDFLFQKIKEAGYKWNDETKTLKK